MGTALRWARGLGTYKQVGDFVDGVDGLAGGCLRLGLAVGGRHGRVEDAAVLLCGLDEGWCWRWEMVGYGDAV